MNLRESDFDIELPIGLQAPGSDALAVNKRIIKTVLRSTGLYSHARIQGRDHHLIYRDLILCGHPFCCFGNQGFLRTRRKSRGRKQHQGRHPLQETAAVGSQVSFCSHHRCHYQKIDGQFLRNHFSFCISGTGLANSLLSGRPPVELPTVKSPVAKRVPALIKASQHADSSQ